MFSSLPRSCRAKAWANNRDRYPDYWYQHEPCWYIRKKNAPWFGKAGENSTIWAAPSPKFIMGGSEEDKFDHPTQKPVDLMRRPILNHIRRGGWAYDPFLGSGTTLAAAEVTGRVCCGMELDPKYVDVVVERWQQLSGEKARLDGDGRTFGEIAERRRPAAAAAGVFCPPSSQTSNTDVVHVEDALAPVRFSLLDFFVHAGLLR